MKESIWLKSYEREVNEKRNKSNGNKKIILIIVPVMMLLMMGAAMMNGENVDTQGQNPMMFFGIIFVVLMIFIIIMLSIGKKKDVAKPTRESVKALLRSDEEVQLFDQQMSATPIKEVEISSETTVFLTQDFVGMRYMYMGDLLYRFMRREDIAFYDYTKTASTTANPIKGAYFFDIRNAQQEVIMNGMTDSGAQMAELEELLKRAMPSIQREKKK